MSNLPKAFRVAGRTEQAGGDDTDRTPSYVDGSKGGGGYPENHKSFLCLRRGAPPLAGESILRPPVWQMLNR